MLGNMAVSEDIAMLIVEIEANVSHYLESLTHGLSEGQFNWKPEAWAVVHRGVHYASQNSRNWKTTDCVKRYRNKIVPAALRVV